MVCDLHCHSKISDGSMGIEEILIMAKRRGLAAIAITDHDAVVGATRACIVGKRLGVEVIHGVEMSTYDYKRNRKVHILGYLCDYPDRLEGACLRTNNARRAAATEMTKKVLRYYPIAPETIARYASGSTNIFKQHVMHALLESGFTDRIYGDLYRKLFSRDGGCAYIPIEYPDVREIIDLIHSAGGLAVMAHPYTYDSIDLMHELVNEGLLDGIEVWHPSNDEERIATLKKVAETNHLLMTGGTDFHGMYTDPVRPIGSCGAPEDTVQKMKAFKLTRNK